MKSHITNQNSNPRTVQEIPFQIGFASDQLRSFHAVLRRRNKASVIERVVRAEIRVSSSLDARVVLPLQDERFVKPVLNIALNREVFRRDDNELEPTLRKCVHALKMIDSGKSNTALKKLEELNNDNVRCVLEMYG